ncbi:TetR family transcriptional regulator [uncultured Pseudodesulfovibrio sp.]|uniref:TetR/AcrR family transcriptional regulator n=1 Tax=uncultured Pseudodesulfovibrio sp. TaxID=2035858 RepID=UPI0029C937D3|nr:TetR family transcriptional regulator [uncultured Pseudodesulfovibrio sp.]
MEKTKKAAETPTAAPKRRRNPVATRKAILDSARLAFTRYGYDRASVRAISENAGVTAMLVKHYFGSKEKLFEEVVEESLSLHGILRSETEKPRREAEVMGRDMAEALVASSPSELSPDGTVILLRSVGNDQAAGILRDNAKGYLESAAEALDGDNPDIRVALCVALISGYKLMRQVVALPALVNADQEEIIRLLAPLFAKLAGTEPE